MRYIAIAFLALATIIGAGLAGEPEAATQPYVVVAPDSEEHPPEPVPQQPSNWEKFKEGVKQAGGATASGTRNAAQKTADAVTHGAQKTGEFFSDGYRDVKEYIHEKTE